MSRHMAWLAGLSRRLPGCSVHAAELPFDEWVQAGFPGLNIAGERAA